MRLGWLGFRLFLVTGWLLVVAVTWHATALFGATAAATSFLADFAQPWRAQFNTDLSLHLVLIAAWMMYRARTWPAALACAAAAVLLGSLFTLPYILAATLGAEGDMRVVLLGRHNLAARL